MQEIHIVQQLLQMNKQRRVLVFAGILSTLLLLRDLGDIGVTKTVFIVIAAIFCLFSDKASIYCLMAFLVPIAHGISYTYIAAIAMVILLLKHRMRVKISGVLIMGVILLIELISALRGYFSFVNYLRFVGIFLIAFLMMIDIDEEYDNVGIVKMFVAGYIVAMVDIFGQMLKRYSWSAILSLKARIGDTRQLLNIDSEGILLSFNPNELGFLCTLTVVLCLMLYKKEKKLWYPILIVIASLIGVTTQSRTFVIVYVFSILMYMCLSMHSLKSAFKVIFNFTIGAVAIIALANRLIPEYIRGILNRFAVSDISNGRVNIMQYYFYEMFQSIDRFIFGVGLQNYKDKYNYFISAHNATQEILISWGIIGLIAVIFLLIVILINAKKINPNALPIQYIPLVIFLIDIQSGQGFSDASGMLCLMVTYSAILIPLKGESLQKYIKTGTIRY